MNEHDFIALLRPLAGSAGLNLDDDAAILTPTPGQDLILSKDTMVEGVHFPLGRIGGGFSERLLRTALSDLAAKGARPIGYMLSVAWPIGRDAKWPNGFVRGLHDAQESFDCPLIGGDTTSTDGPLVASATVLGVVPTGEMVRRSGAKPGDDVWFTGTLGLAEIGLSVVTGRDVDLSPSLRLAAEDAYLRPEPRFEFRKVLRRYATAAADISDGLLSEAGHIAAASGVQIDLNAETVKNATFGDDYELLFTATVDNREAILKGGKAISLPLTRCGRVLEGVGISVDGQAVKTHGYRHRF
ncbi:MAG: thiamine-phosphate kinase [Litorimonas sp.]